MVTAVSFLLLLLLVSLLFLGRTKEALRSNWLLGYWPDFYQHVSNFSISYLLYSAVGYMWILLGVGLSYIVVLGGVILLANFVYEIWIPILNTPDLLDAYYGAAGTGIAFLFLVLTKYFGVRPNSQSS